MKLEHLLQFFIDHRNLFKNPEETKKALDNAIEEEKRRLKKELDFRFDFIITDWETRLESDEWIEEIQVQNRASVYLLPPKRWEDEEGAIYQHYFGVFVVSLLGFLYAIYSVLKGFYQIKNIIFPYNPINDYFNKMTTEILFHCTSSDLFEISFKVNEKLIDNVVNFVINNNLFFSI
jgi:hypothetical protein